MKKTSLLASAVMLAILTACGSKDAAEHYTDAQNYIAEKKYNAAVIELKSAIQQSPQQADYRQALGKLYLQLGDPVSAAKELSRALELGADASVVALPLIQARYLAEDYQAVLAGSGYPPAEAAARNRAGCCSPPPPRTKPACPDLPKNPTSREHRT